jgi:hypothetical protein
VGARDHEDEDVPRGQLAKNPAQRDRFFAPVVDGGAVPVERDQPEGPVENGTALGGEHGSLGGNFS